MIYKLDELPWAVQNAIFKLIINRHIGGKNQRFAAIFFAGACHRIPAVYAINFLLILRLDTCGRHQARIDIHDRNNIFIDRIGGQDFGPTHNRGHANAAFIGFELTAAQWFIHAAKIIIAAIIREEEDDGIIRNALLIEAIQNAPNGLV